MLSRSQEKLLRFLGTFPTDLEGAWDVPRALSLPGLADAMGVVRSGLNQPLNVLSEHGFITVRVAHVLGGGSRRRQVYHITKTGRAWLEEHPETNEPPLVSSVNPSPAAPFLVGREETLKDMHERLEAEGKLVLGGLSGVGKTALLDAYADGLEAEKRRVRCTNVDDFSDAQSVFESWYAEEGPAPRETASMAERMGEEGPTAVFMLDDVDRLNERHREGVWGLLHAAHDAGCTVLLAGRLPLAEGLAWPVLRVGALEPETAATLLGDHLEASERLAIAKALGGHPMALQLHQEGDPLPEAGADVQAFVEHTMLNSLSEEERSGLDLMVLYPRPLVPGDSPGGEAVDALDDRALLRWASGSGRVEVQHLVRNVRRAMLDEEDLHRLHTDSLDHWHAHADRPEAGLLRLYHAMALNSDRLDAWIDEDFDRLAATDAGALAVLFHRATQQHPENERLHYWAGRVAVQRNELERARSHLEQVQDEALCDDLAHAMALLEGDEANAQRLLERQLERAASVERTRLVLRTAVQRLDDRLYDEASTTDAATVHELLNAVELPEHGTVRATVTVSLSLIRHALALQEGDETRALALADQLEGLSRQDDPLVQQMNLKTQLHLRGRSGASVSDLRTEVDAVMGAQPSALHRAAVGMTYAEHLAKESSEQAAAFLSTLVPPDQLEGAGPPSWRYAARWWYLAGRTGVRPAAMALREAARWFRQAGCLGAAKAVTRRLHRVL
jgi:DNA-binding MarR family transcriptional regulator